MKAFKRIIQLGLVGAVAFSLAACGKGEFRNQTTPYGTISASKTVASIKNEQYKISEKELYDRLKYKNGYSAMIKELDKYIYKDEFAELTFDKYKTDLELQKNISKRIANDVYSTDDLDKLRSLDEETIKISQQKYIDSKASEGIKVKVEEITFDEIKNDTEYVTFSKIGKQLFTYYVKDEVIKMANEEYLVENSTEEIIPNPDEEGAMMKNPNYISSKDVEAYYESTVRNYSESKGIILRYNTLADAQRALAKVNSITDVEEKFIQLYNNYYSYETPITTIGENDKTTFIINDEQNEFSSYSSQLQEIFLEKTKEGEAAGQGGISPINLDGKYYLIYRESTVYEATGLTEAKDYKELTAEQKTDVDKITKDYLLKSKSSSVTSEVYQERMEELNVKIYDPYLEYQFSTSYTDYEFVTESNNDYVFTVENANLKVDDFYSTLLNYNTTEVLSDLLMNKYVYAEMQSYLVEDAKSDFESSLKDDLKSFNKGTASLPNLYSESNYLYYSYGYNTFDEVVMNRLASDIITTFTKDYINDNWATSDHKLNTEATKNIENILNTSVEAYNNKKLFDIEIDHLLLSIDTNGDGEYDNMNAFISGLSADEAANFNNAVRDLFNAILNELAHIKYPNTFEELNYIVDAFNNDEPIYSQPGKTWAYYKTYPFVLKAEELGEKNQDSIKDFVTPFQDYLISIFDKAVSDSFEIKEEDNDKGFLYSPVNGLLIDSNNVAKSINVEQDLCKTDFGYHLISLKDYEDTKDKLSFYFPEDEDYKDPKIILDKKDPDTENDDIYFVGNVFNTNEDSSKPTLEQALIYFVESTQGEVTSFKTSIKNNLSTLLDEAISKYKTEAFQKFILLSNLGDFKISDEKVSANFDMDTYVTYLKNQSENYKPDSTYADWYDSSKTIWII